MPGYAIGLTVCRLSTTAGGVGPIHESALRAQALQRLASNTCTPIIIQA